MYMWLKLRKRRRRKWIHDFMSRVLNMMRTFERATC
jgi:hypothetical protein